MSIHEKHLAINGGAPVSKEVIVIHKPHIDDDDIRAVAEATRSTFVSGDGPACREFEKRLADYLGVKHVLFVNSATSALDLAFKAKSFPPGSEVLVPNFTYTSTALGPLLNQLKVVLVDVNPEDGNLDPKKIEQAVTPRTVAITPVDYAGNPADMDAIVAVARKHGLYVVHDTAQSMGSEYKGRKTGNFGDVSTFSFHGTKNISTGEGGALVTNDDDLAARVIILREKGTNKHAFLTDSLTRGYYEYQDIGGSYVQSNILGALGVTQLAKLDRLNERRREIAEYYLKNFRTLDNTKLPSVTEDARTNWHLFYLRVPPAHKYWIMDALRAEGIYANVHYTPLHRNKYYAHLGTDETLPNSMEFFGGLLRVPIYPSLTDPEMKKVAQAVHKVMAAVDVDV